LSLRGNTTNFCLMNKYFLAVCILLNAIIANAQNKGCGHPAVSSDHGGYCSSNTKLIDTAYFNTGDTVLFSYGASGSNCDYVSNNQIYYNSDAITTPPPANTWSYFKTTNPGTYRFEWYQNINWNFTIELIENTPNSIKKINKKNLVKIFPNPTSGKFIIELEESNSNQTVVEIFDITGNIISNNNLTEPIIVLDISSHPKGFYMVKITNGQQVFIEKLIYQ